MKSTRTTQLWTGLIYLMILSLVISVFSGSTHHSFHETWVAFGQKTNTLHTILFQLRIPRTLCAFIVGGLLGLSGALMQTLLRNPLADPYVLGLSGGAALFGLLAILIGLSPHYLTLWTFIGSWIAILLVVFLSRSSEGPTPLRLLLTGIIVASGFSALISLILTLSPNAHLHSMLFWLMGDLSYARFSYWQPILLLFGLFVTLFLGKSLNVLAFGDLAAQSLGINTRRTNQQLYLLCSLLTAGAVSIAGCIGFVGLIVPHSLRLITGSDHRIILPASVILGGSFVTLADTVARIAMPPIELPVGIVMAIIGVPCFLFLLKRSYSY